jgi:hypothetical protein
MALVDRGSVMAEAGLATRLAAKSSSTQRLSSADFRLNAEHLVTTPPLPSDALQQLGADPDHVGPGLPYQQWRQSPAYEKWLSETAPPANR